MTPRKKHHLSSHSHIVLSPTHAHQPYTQQYFLTKVDGPQYWLSFPHCWLCQLLASTVRRTTPSKTLPRRTVPLPLLMTLL